MLNNNSDKLKIAFYLEKYNTQEAKNDIISNLSKSDS